MNRFVRRFLMATGLLVLCAALFSAALAERSGTWGENLTWVLDDEGMLTISGTGDMDEFLFASSDARIATVDANGVVTGRAAGTVTITATAESGVSAACEVSVTGLKILNLPANLTTIEGGAFASLKSAEAIRIPVGVTHIADDAFYGSNVIIIAPKGGYAAVWASEHGLKVVEE